MTSSLQAALALLVAQALEQGCGCDFVLALWALVAICAVVTALVWALTALEAVRVVLALLLLVLVAPASAEAEALVLVLARQAFSSLFSAQAWALWEATVSAPSVARSALQQTARAVRAAQVVAGARKTTRLTGVVR